MAIFKALEKTPHRPRFDASTPTHDVLRVGKLQTMGRRLALGKLMENRDIFRENRSIREPYSVRNAQRLFGFIPCVGLRLLSFSAVLFF